MAKTKNGIVYPDNYDKVADVPADLKELAESVDEVIENNKTEMKKSNETRDEKISKNVEDIGIIQETIKSEKESIDKSLENINTKDEKQDEDIKANKESIEELQAENLEIKAENERLREDIKSIATIGEASGENIHLEDSSEARCEIKICGNQKQDVRIGKNKLLNDTASMTINGVTFTKNDDGSVIANGTATDGINYYLSEISTTIEAGIYKLSDGVNNESSTTYFTYVDCKNEDGSAYDAGNLSTVGKSSKAYSEPKLIRGRIAVRKGSTLSNVLFKPQLELVKSVNDVATDYEQYGASPSIDFPSELKAVGDDINILNDTIFARKGYYSGIVGATTQKANTTIRLLTDEDINVISNKDITISLGTDKDLKYNVFEIDENDVIIKNNMSSNNKDKTIKLQENTKKISLMLMWQDANKTITLEDIKDCKIKIAYGTRISNYSSYNCGSAKIDIFNKNFIDIDKLKSLNSRNAYEKYNNVECLKLAGVTQRYNLNCKQNTQYVFQVNIVGYTYTSKLIGQFLIAYTDGSTSYMQTDGTNAGKYSLISKAGKTVKALVWNGYSSGHFAYIDKNDIQLDEATTLTNIVQHEEQSYLVDVQQPMFEGDTFVRQDGKWYEKHCWKKMLLNGTEKAGVSGASTNEILAIVYDINNAVDGFGYSNYFLYSSQVELNKMSVYNGGKSLRVNVSKMQFADSESFKAKLKELYEAGTPVIIYYKLAKPELIECTKAQSKVLDEIYNKSHTYKNITNISAESAEVNPIINVKYLKDTEIEHNKLQAQIDEIKELLSTTETSALLLDNIQKELESEV